MNKNRGYLYLLALVSIMACAGCEKFLEVVPKGKDVAQTYEHYLGMLNYTNMANLSLYKQLAGGGSTSYGSPDMDIYMSPDWITNDYHYQYSLSTDLARKSYIWSADIYTIDDNAPEWGSFYVRNYPLCKIIDEVMDATTGTHQEKLQVQSEARIFRAWLHFKVLNYFAKPYNAATASSDPGVPIVTKALSGQTGFKRESVQACYDFIVREITEALPTLPSDARSVHRTRIGGCAAHSILSKVYLYMKKYPEAQKEAEAALALLPNADFSLAMYNYNTMFPSWGYNPERPYTGPSMPNHFNSTETILTRVVSTMFITGMMARGVFIHPDVYALYGPNDWRGKLYSTAEYSGAPIAYNPEGYMRKTAPTSNTAGPTIPELYLTIAECQARSGNLTGAKATLETFRAYRMPAEDAALPSSVVSQDDYIRFAIDERTREMVLTGDGWFTLRRLWDDPLFAGKTYARTINGQTYTLSAERLVMRIPPTVLQFNQGSMQDNP